MGQNNEVRPSLGINGRLIPEGVAGTQIKTTLANMVYK